MTAVNPLYAAFKTDSKLEQEGVWFDYGPNSKGKPMRVLLARAGGANSDYTKALEKVTKPYRKAISAGALDTATINRLYMEVFIGTVVKGLENFEDGACQPLSCNPADLTRLLTELPDLYADWQEQANRLAVFRAELMDADVGNSGQS